MIFNDYVENKINIHNTNLHSSSSSYPRKVAKEPLPSTLQSYSSMECHFSYPHSQSTSHHSHWPAPHSISLIKGSLTRWQLYFIRWNYFPPPLSPSLTLEIRLQQYHMGERTEKILPFEFKVNQPQYLIA